MLHNSASAASCCPFLQYRARLARMQAALAVDPEAKRQLLRQAEASLRMCLGMDSSDARGYVVLGKLLVQQKRYDEARKLYADGTTATGEAGLWAP
jgi:cytochrome c-type biogenesis protein CcmH/NrfG